MYLGLDLGTSGLKALLLDEQQQVVAVATASLRVSRPYPGWSEQNPSDWVAACRQVFTELREHLCHVKAIGIVGHMHGVVLVGEDGGVVRPCLLWNDTRASEQATTMDANPLFRQISGTIVFPGFSAPKMAWIRDSEPEIWAKAHQVLFPKDYLAFWLTGRMACEPSDAAGAALFDCENGCWSHALCDAAKLSFDLLPPIVASDASRGKIKPELVADFGLDPECVVAGGAGDNAAASIGIGAVRNGEGQVSLGTSGVLLTVNENWMPDAGTAVHSFNHAVSGCYIQMGVTLTATDSLSWLADLLGKESKGLANALPLQSDGPSDLLFLPYLAGERTPYNLDKAMGVFFGLSRNHGTLELTQAVMEGVAYSLADCARALETTGAKVEKLTAVGGGARSRFWLQTLADILQRPLSLNPNAEHAAALGGARLAIAAETGQSVADVVAAAATTFENFETVQPRSELADAYQAAVKKYRKLFDVIKEL